MYIYMYIYLCIHLVNTPIIPKFCPRKPDPSLKAQDAEPGRLAQARRLLQGQCPSWAPAPRTKVEKWAGNG